jgi:hypothetical protein
MSSRARERTGKKLKKGKLGRMMRLVILPDDLHKIEMMLEGKEISPISIIMKFNNKQQHRQSTITLKTHN